eukprot:c33762_g1_i1 orf=1-225(-)
MVPFGIYGQIGIWLHLPFSYGIKSRLPNGTLLGFFIVSTLATGVSVCLFVCPSVCFFLFFEFCILSSAFHPPPPL